MLKTSNPKAIASPGGMYSHSVGIPPGARTLYTAGQIVVRPDGSIANNFEEQDDQIWKNTLAILADAGMGLKILSS
jgi:2-iminobutanoate/2-iminopropanoate deaminase